MYILGISCFFHDAAAALLKDGEIIAAAEEERFTRKKHDNSFPIHAVEFCLAQAGITIKDIAYVGFYEKPFLKFERVLSQHMQMFPKSYRIFIESTPEWLNHKLRVPKIVKKKLKYNGPVLFIEHHLAHAASTFLVSPFEHAAIVTVDGVGEWSTTTYGKGAGNDIELMKEIRFPHSLGLLYSAITAYLGFSVNNSEYKVMGLAAYGNMDRGTNPYYEKLKKVIDIKSDGSYRFNLDYFVYHFRNRMPSQKLCELLGGPVLPRGGALENRHKDIAAGLQLIFEDAMRKILGHAHEVTHEEAVVLSGGCALNSVMNGKILRSTPFKKIWIQPNATDGGTSIGVAAYIYHSLLGNPRREYQKTAYLGPEYSRKEIKSFLDTKNVVYSEFGNDYELVAKTARLIRDGNVVGWFEGRMEWGPRALGARSILADPTRSDIKDLLNLKVKHREKFRPFAPVVCADDAPTYFDCDIPVPEPTDFMLMVYPIKKGYHKLLTGVTHVDGSGRLQTIRREQNPLYYDVIKEFGKLSGTPILVNTSFNIRGEPIVCTPEDAYRCMMGTGIDMLVMGRFLVKRSENLKDVWDSERYAND